MGGRRWPGQAGIADPGADRKTLQAEQPVGRDVVDRGEITDAGQLNVGVQRSLGDDDEVRAQVRGPLGDFPGQVGGRDDSQDAVIEMRAHFVIVRGGPAGRRSAGKPGDQPAQLGQSPAFRLTGRADLLFQRGPAGQAVLPRDGGLRLVQGGKFARGQAAFRLEPQVPQARSGGQ